MLNTQPAEVNDFSGGIVDDYINANPRTCQVADNLDCIENKSLLTRPGSVIDETDPLHDQIPAGVQAVRTLINYNNNDTLIVHSAKRLYYRNPTAYATLTGPTGNQAFDVGDVGSCVAHAQWNGHLYVTNNDYARPQKIYKDSGGTLRIRNAGLPALASAPNIAVGLAGSKNYLYAFLHHYTYTVGNQTFEDFGPVTEVELAGSDDPSVNNNSITAIPVLSNGSTNNWDTTVIKIYIYRTIDAGTTFYKIGEVTNGTTTFTDTFADSAIQDNLVLYTEGGVVENEPPPLAKYVHIVQNRAYYGNIKEGSEILKYDVRQSIDGDPDSVPSNFYDTVEDEVTGLSSVNEVPIVLCKKHIYRIEDRIDELGRGSMNHVRIHDTAGCISHNSCVQAEQMLFWAGNDGFWMTDGYKAIKITDHINRKYKSMVEAARDTGDTERIVGTFDEANRRVMWTVQQNSSTQDHDTIFVLDLRWGVSPNTPIRTWSGGDGTSFRPTAIVFFNDLLYRADTRGYVLIHSPDYTTDAKIDQTADAADWARETIIWRYKSPASNFGSSFVKKWVPRILLTAKNRSNISIQLNAINDDGKFTRALSPIRYRNNFEWGDIEFVWGDADFVWNSEGLIEEWRRFPARGLRVSYLQMEVTNAYSVITNSDTIGTATINPATNTVTLDDAATSDWPVHSVDYYVSFDIDNYMQQYLVLSRTDDTLTVADPNDTLPVGSYKWLLKGYRKDEILNLLSLTVHFALLGKTQTNEGGVDTGANA